MNQRSSAALSATSGNPATSLAGSFGSMIKAALSALFLDRLGNASRPKLLFAVAAADALSVILSWPLANELLGIPVALSFWGFVAAFFVSLIVIALLHGRWSYSIAALHLLNAQVLKVLASVGITALAVSGVAFMTGDRSISPSQVATWMATTAIVLCCIRSAAARVIDHLTRIGCLVRRTVIVGGGQDADDLIQALNADPTHRICLLGIFDDRQDDRSPENHGSITKLGTFETLAGFCRDAAVDLLIVTVPPRAEERLMQILCKLFALQVDVRISALNSKLRLNSRAYSYVGRVPMLAVMDKPLNDWDRVLKNLEDRLIGGLLLLVALPVMAIVTLAVRLESRGPILFRQKRYGFNNELIEVFKFRSMYVDRQDATASKLVTRDDPRVTRVGRIIRRASLDELPQLFNVVLGQMSLVGPRPHATGAKADRDLYETVAQGYFARHRVKPGVTGWAQVNGWRGETDTHEKLVRRVEHDLYYIDNWSLLFDLYIIAMTPFSLVTGKNAY